MAKATTIKIRLVSSADTGYFYVTKKNSRTMTEKMVVRKYDPVARKHVEFKEPSQGFGVCGGPETGWDPHFGGTPQIAKCPQTSSASCPFACQNALIPFVNLACFG